MQYTGSLEAAENFISAKIFEDLHTSVKILQICMDLQDSVQRSLQNPAEKNLQRFAKVEHLGSHKRVFSKNLIHCCPDTINL